MTRTIVTCRSDYHTDTDYRREHDSRIIRCNLPADHDGDHDEMVDGEPGVIAWPRRPRTPETRAMPTLFPAAVVEIVDRHGSHYRRDTREPAYWRQVDLEPASYSWPERILLAHRGPLTEVVADA